MAEENSYDYSNLVRDLSDEMAMIMKSEPVLLALILMGAEAINTKHEWLEDVMEPERDALNGAISANDTTAFVVDDSSKFAAGMILAFEGYDELVRVTAVTAATHTLTVTRGYGGTTALASIADNTVVIIISRPLNEGTTAGSDAGREPAADYNYTQIEDFTAKVTKTAQAVQMYGIANALNYQVQNGLKILARRWNNAVIYGRRVQRTASVPGSMGGILQFLSQAGANVVDASAAALSDTLMNNLIEQIVLDGGRPNAILCNTLQARKISAFNADNLMVESMGDAGQAVYRFVNDLPMGIIQNIVIDLNFPKAKLAMLDMSKIRLVPLRGRNTQDEDATPPGADYYARRILGEMTLEVKNAKQAHGLLTNLAVN